MRSTRSSTKQIELAPLSGDELNQTQQIEPRNPKNTTRAKGAQNVQGAAQKQTGKQKRNHENRKAAVPSSKTTMKARAKRKKVKIKPAGGTRKQKQNVKLKQTQTVHNPASVQQNSDESGGQDQETKSSSAVKSEVKEEPTTADSEPPWKKQKRNKDKPPKPPLEKVPDEFAFRFYLALASGDLTQILPFKEYFNLPFQAYFHTTDTKNCDCVVKRLRAFEQANCPTKDMRTYFNGRTDLRCEEKDRTRRNSASDDIEYGFYNMKFYPIHMAAVFGYVDVLTRLMKNGADLYAKTQPSEMYAFELALKHGQSSFAKAVFYRGFSYKSPFNLRPDKRTSELMTVEHLIKLARQDYWIDVSQYVRLGIKAGLPFRMKDWAWNLKDALNRDATSEYLCILKCRVGDVNTIVRNFDQSILYYALDADAVMYLFEHGFNVDKFFAHRKKLRASVDPPVPNRPTTTILFHMLKEKRFNAAEELILRHKNVMNEKGCMKPKVLRRKFGAGLKPLHMCAATANKEGLELLIKYGADLNEISSGLRNWSVVNLIVLAKAKEEARLECLEIILRQSITVINHRGEDGNTALINAASRRHSEAVSILLKHGADPSLYNETTGANALWYIMAANDSYSRSAVLPLLYANIPESLCRKTLSTVFPKWYLNRLCIEGDTPYDMALSSGEDESLRAFVEAGWFVQETWGSNLRYRDYYYLTGKEDKSLWYKYVSNPPTLQWFSKRAIRRSLPVFPHKVINQLPIPEKLQRYVLMVDRDCDEQPRSSERLEKFDWYGALHKPNIFYRTDSEASSSYSDDYSDCFISDLGIYSSESEEHSADGDGDV